MFSNIDNPIMYLMIGMLVQPEVGVMPTSSIQKIQNVLLLLRLYKVQLNTSCSVKRGDVNTILLISWLSVSQSFWEKSQSKHLTMACRITTDIFQANVEESLTGCKPKYLEYSRTKISAQQKSTKHIIYSSKKFQQCVT